MLHAGTVFHSWSTHQKSHQNTTKRKHLVAFLCQIITSLLPSLVKLCRHDHCCKLRIFQLGHSWKDLNVRLVWDQQSAQRVRNLPKQGSALSPLQYDWMQVILQSWHWLANTLFFASNTFHRFWKVVKLQKPVIFIWPKIINSLKSQCKQYQTMVNVSSAMVASSIKNQWPQFSDTCLTALTTLCHSVKFVTSPNKLRSRIHSQRNDKI